MKPSAWLVGALALVLGFGVGRATAPAGAARSGGPAALPQLSDPESFRLALDEQDWLERTYRMSAFLEHLAPDNVDAAARALEAKLPWLVTDELRLFMFAWSRFDPRGALERTFSWSRLFRRSGSGAAIYAWAYRDPAGALEALQAIANPELRDFMEKRLIAGWAHGPHKSDASAYIAALPEGPRRFEYVGMLAWELSKDGFPAVTAWAEGVPDLTPRYKKAAFIKAAGTLGALDPPRTAEWLAGHADRDHGLEGLRVLARTWAIAAPEAAVDWARSLPDGRPARAAVRSAFDTWLDRWPDDAMRWLFDATPDPRLDPALHLVMERKGVAPEVAQRFAGRLSEGARGGSGAQRGARATDEAGTGTASATP